MRKHQIVLIGTVIAFSLAVFAHRSTNLAQETPAAGPQGIAERERDVEYKVVSFAGVGRGAEESFTNGLNKLQREGWQYAFVVTATTKVIDAKERRKTTFIAFQRPK